MRLGYVWSQQRRKRDNLRGANKTPVGLLHTGASHSASRRGLPSAGHAAEVESHNADCRCGAAPLTTMTTVHSLFHHNAPSQ